MSVNAAGSSGNVQQAMTMLRQTVQAEQLAASAAMEAVNQASKQAAEPNAQPGQGDRGAVVDVQV